MMHSMWELREEFTDVVLICNNGQTTFRAHKIFLAAASPFLRNLLLKSDKMSFPKISKSEMESILESIYKGEPDSLTKLAKLETLLATPKQRIPASITSLPPEVLCNILSFLPTQTVLHKVAFVSKQFRELTKTPSVHKVVQLPSSSSSIVPFLKKATLMTDLYFQNKSECKKLIITAEQLVKTVSNHIHIRNLNFETDRNAPYLYFIPMSHTTWWQNLTKFNMEFGEGYERLSNLPEFAIALNELGSKGNVTHFGIGSSRLSYCSQAVFTFLICPNLSKLKYLTLYDKYSLDMLDKITIARQDTLQALMILNVHGSASIPNCPKLRALHIAPPLFSAEHLPDLQNLIYLKIVSFERHCEVPPKSMPNLLTLKVGASHRHFAVIGQIHPNPVSLFYKSKFNYIVIIEQQVY